MAGKRKLLVLTLAPDEWKLLEGQAAANERDPHQQARWLLVRELRKQAELSEESEHAEVA